jgi:hypothetical protein
MLLADCAAVTLLTIQYNLVAGTLTQYDVILNPFFKISCLGKSSMYIAFSGPKRHHQIILVPIQLPRYLPRNNG